MYKAILLAAVAVAGVVADISQFPSFDAFHANCAMEVTYAGKQCTAVFTDMKNLLTQYEGGDPGKGIYKFIENK
jgi:hypothetical protein